MAAVSNWSRRMLELVREMDAFNKPGAPLPGKQCIGYNNLGSSKGSCRPFFVENVQVGYVPQFVLNDLSTYPEVFVVVRDLLTSDVKYVTLNPQLSSFRKRTDAVHWVMKQFREKKKYSSLKGWRSEPFAVSSSFYSKALLEMERSAICLLGIRQYGVHLNGYVKNVNRDILMWIGRRSSRKQTWPGKFDNTVAGGIASGDSIQKTLVKECKEEANIPSALAERAKPVGTVSYFYEDERGLFPETQFVFDLRLPKDFEPRNTDGEVCEFHLLPIDEVKELIATEEFKPNCALVVLDFLLRHGLLNPDEEPNYMEFVKGLHRDGI